MRNIRNRFLLGLLGLAIVLPTSLYAQQSVSATPENESALDVAEAAIVKSDWKSATTHLDGYLKLSPNDSRALFDAGYVADAEGRTDDAETYYRRATLAEPKSFRAHLSYGLLLARMGKTDLSHSELLTATQLDAGDLGPEMKARAWRALAELDRPHGKSGNAEAATNDLLEALKISKETPEDILLAAELAEDSGHYDDAITAYRRVLKANPNSAPANTALAHLLIVRKNFDEAESLLRTALEQAPDSPALNAQLAAVLAAQDKAEALPVLEKLHSIHPEDTSISRMLEQVYATAGDYESSEKLCVTLLIATPNDVVVLVDHGQNLIHLGQYTAALDSFQKAVESDNTNADAWSGLAFAASKTNHPGLTVQALDKRSSLVNENASTWFLRATAYDTLHDKANAIRGYQEFLKASAGKNANQEWQAKERLKLLAK